MKSTTASLIVLSVIIIGTMAARALMSRQGGRVPPIAPAQVPTTLEKGRWVMASVQKISHDVEESLKPQTYVERFYASRLGSSYIDFLLVAGNNRRTFHDPHDCFLGSGFELKDVGVVSIPTKVGPLELKETHVVDSINHVKYEMMYCYVTGGKERQSTAQIDAQILKQTFFGDNGRPSYFVRFRQLRAGVSPGLRNQLIQFITAMWNHIGPILKSTSGASVH